MNIFIVGLGTIGEPLARLFLEARGWLGIDEIIIHKHTPRLEDRGMLVRFHTAGARLAVFAERQKDFETLLAPYGMKPSYTFEEALEKRADIVIDCTAEKIGRALKDRYYTSVKRVRGFIGQGSEKGFGKPYAYRVNDQALIPDEDRFIQVVSCNTHQILVLLKTITHLESEQYVNAEHLQNIVRARFHIDRRSSDISQTQSTVGVEIGVPTHSLYGSHQGEDAARVLETVGISYLDIHTIADKINNPFMHSVRFDIELRKLISLNEIERRFRNNPLTAVTYRRTNNQVFAEGRDWGHFGRILNQTVISLPSLEVRADSREVIGSCFTPQDGNALLSSVAATLWLLNPETYQQKIHDHFYKLPFLFDEV